MIVATRLLSLATLLLPLSTLAQINPPTTTLGVPAQPAAQGVDVRNAAAAAQALSEQLNGTAPGTIVTERPNRVLLGADAETAPPPRARGFMQPSFAPLPGTPTVPQGGQPGFTAGYATPGFFSMRRDQGPPAVENLYTAPPDRDPLNSTAP